MYHKMVHHERSFMYKPRNKDFVKLTIRVNENDLIKFKKLCQINGISCNNQINIYIRQALYFNRNLFDNENEIIDFWDEKNMSK